jgi:polar amino acid transport system substrate-binding protein
MFKKGLSVFALLFVIGFTMFLGGCTSSNVFTYIIDESYDKFIVMGTSADYAPYEWPMNVDEVQTIVGIDIEIGKAIAKELGMNLKVVNKGFDYLLDDLSSGKVDFVIAGMTPTDARAEIVDFSNIYYEAHQVILVQTESVSTFTTLESLNSASIRIAAQMGAIQQDLAEENFPLSQKVYLQAVPDLVLKLTQGLVEAVVLEQPVAEGYVTNIEGLSILDLQIGELDGGSAVAVEKGNADLLASINIVLAELISSGKLDQIISDMIILNSTTEE